MESETGRCESGRAGRHRVQQSVVVIGYDEPWAILVAGLVATAIKVLDGHRRDRANTCQGCGMAWPCEPACTAEMNLMLARG